MWVEEIVELHAFFQGRFFGEIESMDRLQAALAPEFTMVGPNGAEVDRATTIGLVADVASPIEIETVDHELLLDAGDVLVARYREVHRIGDESTQRMSTVVFRRDPDAPNGLLWVRVHETWAGDQN